LVDLGQQGDVAQPAEGPTFVIASYDPDAKAELHASMLENPDSAAVVRFNVFGRDVMDFIDLKRAGVGHVPAERISELNRKLQGGVVIVARRDRPVSSECD
jgi:hypothetical protein